MHYILPALTGILASTVLAVPNNKPPSCMNITDNFDNIPGTAAGHVAVGVYNGITYQAFNADAKSPLTGSTGGVVPHSGSQDIVVGATNDIMQFGAVVLSPFGNIISTPSKAFDLYSFEFGCGLAAEQPVASSSEACVISVIGFTIGGLQLPVATFSYTPTSSTAAPMNLAILPTSYRELKNVTIGVAASTIVPTESLIWVDDVVHCNYT